MFTHLIGSQPDHHRSSSTLFNRQTATEKTAPGPGKTCLPSSPALAAPAPLGVKSHQVKELENHRLQKCRFETGTSVDVPLLDELKVSTHLVLGKTLMSNPLSDNCNSSIEELWWSLLLLVDWLVDLVGDLLDDLVGCCSGICYPWVLA